MNKILTMLVIISALFMTSAIAHIDHGVITEQQALNIAAKTVSKVTFKDLGFEIGKLDESWKGLDKSQFSIVKAENEFFVVRVSNPSNGNKVYFKIASNGRVLAAKSSLNF